MTTVVEALAKGAIAGLTVAAILLLRNRFQWAGILVVMPVITASSFLYVGLADGPDAARKLALTALLALPTVIVFVAAMYVFLARFNTLVSLALSCCLWVLSALAYIWLTR